MLHRYLKFIKTMDTISVSWVKRIRASFDAHTAGRLKPLFTGRGQGAICVVPFVWGCVFKLEISLNRRILRSWLAVIRGLESLG